MKLQSHGIETNLPPGWEGRIAMRVAPEEAAVAAAGGGVTPRGHAEEDIYPVVHLGNFPLPDDRGDFGSGAVDLMRDGDVLIVLAEYGPECAGTALFSHRGLPSRLTPNMFSSMALQRTLPGQAGCQIWLTDGGRAFCLYVVIGRQSNAARVLPAANQTLKATRIHPR